MNSIPLHHRILAASYYPLKFAKTVGQMARLVSNDSLRVLLYHDIAPQYQASFQAQLKWLRRSWKFVSAEHFTEMVSGERPILGRNLLLTFDDGFASNRIVAEEVLNPLGIRALFFAVSDLVELADRDEARQFIGRNIYLTEDIDSLPPHWQNMRWADLEALLQQGHCIGAHTRTHARLSEIQIEKELEDEIIGSADKLERRLGVPIEHFAYTFGDLASFSEEALLIARRRFRFVYSGLRGDNLGVSPLALRREGVTPSDSLALVGAFVEGAADFHYSRSRARLTSWACNGQVQL